uniref:Uncharacterized protein n=1 Tax=Romanomermis culicivorax TaxID=13658 RepID=A0A915HT04_ROMCU
MQSKKAQKIISLYSSISANSENSLIITLFKHFKIIKSDFPISSKAAFAETSIMEKSNEYSAKDNQQDLDYIKQ